MSRLLEEKTDLTQTINNCSENVGKKLAITYNKIIKKINRDMINIHKAGLKFNIIAQDISSSSTQLSISSKNQADGVAPLLDQVTTFEKGQQHSLEEINNLNDIVEKTEKELLSLTETMNQITSSTHQSIEEVQSSSKLLEKGIDDFEKTSFKVEEMNLSMNNLTQLIKAAENQTQQINAILSVITDISERTNMLATNASIQAAHAGEAGKGFTVVAKEIRSLAYSTAQKIDQIEQSVSQTVKAVKEAASIGQHNQKHLKELNSSIDSNRSNFNNLKLTLELLSNNTITTENLLVSQETKSQTTQEYYHQLKGTSENIRNFLNQQSLLYKNIENVVNTNAYQSQSFAKASATLSSLGDYLALGAEEMSQMVHGYRLSAKKDFTEDTTNRQQERFEIMHNMEINIDNERIGYIMNISSGGMLIATNKDYKSGQKYNFNIPDVMIAHSEINNIRFCGDIRWTENKSVNFRAHRMGISIKDISENDQQALTTLLKTLKYATMTGLDDKETFSDNENNLESLDTIDNAEEVEEVEML